MRGLFAALILVHGLIHLMGFAKAFRLAELPQLTQAISASLGLLWLVAALSLVGAGILFLRGLESWWLLGAPAVVLSQILVFSSWSDAKMGTVANLLLLLPLLAAGLDSRPASFRNQYQAAVREGLARQVSAPLVSEADLASVPAPVQKYLRYVGVLGKPRIESVRAEFRGEFRNGIEGRWMSFRAEQVNFYDEPTRLFLMRASSFGLPAEGLHVYRGPSATMRIRLASLVPLADASGPEMDQGETVTLFNDICLMTPTGLLDRERVAWEEVSALSARARFTNQGHAIRALLSFNEAGQLVDFVSDDRFLSADGKSYARHPWSTPVRDYTSFEGRMVPTRAEAVWSLPEGPFVYGRFEVVGIRFNLRQSR